MIQIGHTVVSEDILEKEFVCNLSACKGACCVLGDAGAPLQDEETKILEKIQDAVSPYLRPEGRKAVSEQGAWVVDNDGDLVTPLIDNKECAYVVFDEHNTALCGIEKAWKDGAVDFRKPVSCHLYPIRISKYSTFDAVNYDKWEICTPACTLGKELSVPVYRFVGDALIRHYGEAWYKELEEVAKAYGNR